MLRLVRATLAIVGATILMLAIGYTTLTIARLNPSVHFAYFYSLGGVAYIVLIMFAISRNDW